MYLVEAMGRSGSWKIWNILAGAGYDFSQSRLDKEDLVNAAALSGHAKIIRYLGRKGWLRGSQVVDALFIAINFGKSDVVKSLMRAGTRVPPHRLYKAINNASRVGHHSVLEFFPGSMTQEDRTVAPKSTRPMITTGFRLRLRTDIWRSWST